MAWHDEYRVWLSQSQSLSNAQNVVDHLYGNTDWSRESICALVGNMRHESSINPDMYEYGYAWSANRGYGLVQWTPRSKYWDWAEARGKNPRDGDSQLDRIDYEVSNNIQWIPRSDYGSMTFAQFRSNSGDWSVDHLTEAFTWGYERPNAEAGWKSMPERKAFARLAYDELDWSGSGGGGGSGGGDGGDGGDGSGGGDGESGGSSITYVESLGDLLFIHIDNGERVKAYPATAQRWLAEANSFGSTGDGSNGDGGDNGDGGNGGGNGGDGGGSDPKGEWAAPVDSKRCTQAYGSTSWSDYHSGMDIGAINAGQAGDTIYAVYDGVVERVGGHQQVLAYHSGNGCIVNLGKHGGDTIYQYVGHCQSVTVKQGDKVAAGDPIAVMGGSGAGPNDFAVHLHLTMYKNVSTNTSGATVVGPNDTFDPEKFLRDKGVLDDMNACPR